MTPLLLAIATLCQGQEPPSPAPPAVALIAGAPLIPPDGVPLAAVRRGLERTGLEVRDVSPEQAAGGLGREAFDIVAVVSTGRGVSPELLAALAAFQQAGGGLLFIGDVPHDGPGQLQDLQLARCPTALLGVPLRLTPAGTEAAAGAADVAEAICGQPIVIRGYPPDRLTAWADAGPLARGVAGVIVRRSWALLGSRAGVLGVAAGGGQPALRGPDRGMELLVAGLAAAVRPAPLVATIAAQGLARVGAETDVSVYIRNNSRQPVPTVEVVLRLQEPQQRQLLKERLVNLQPGEARALRGAVQPSAPGAWRLTAAATAPQATATDAHTIWAHAATPGAEEVCAFGLRRFDFGGNGPVAYSSILSALGAAGAGRHQVAVPWAQLEPEPGQYQFGVVDDILTAAAAQGASVDLEIAPEPRTTPDDPLAIPQWALRSPAVDAAGRPGAFPALAGEDYQARCGRLAEILATRYWNARGLASLSLDLCLARQPYAYDAGADAPWRFDYSVEERAAFGRYLRETAQFSLTDLVPLWDGPLPTWDEVCPPTPEQATAWGLYEEFRLGRIRDLTAALHEALPPQSRQLPLGQLFGPPFYGCAAWFAEARVAPQVRWRSAAEAARLSLVTEAGAPRVTIETPPAETTAGGGAAATFAALRCGAPTVLWAQAEEGVDAEELSRLGFVLATCRGAARPAAQVGAVSWEASPEPSAQLAWLAACLDEPCDLIAPSEEGRWPNWRLALLCPAEHRLGPERCGLRLMSRSFVQGARDYVQRGGRLALFACNDAEDPALPGRPTLRSVLGLEALRYSALGRTEVRLGSAGRPTEGAGAAAAPTWDALAVEGVQGTTLATTADGRPVVVSVPLGLGQVILVGAADAAATMPPDWAPGPAATQGGGVLPWLLTFAQVDPPGVDSGEQCLLKVRLRSPGRGAGEVVALYNPFGTAAQVRLGLAEAGGRGPVRDLEAWAPLPTESAGGRLTVSLDVPAYGGRFVMVGGR